MPRVSSLACPIPRSRSRSRQPSFEAWFEGCCSDRERAGVSVMAYATLGCALARRALLIALGLSALSIMRAEPTLAQRLDGLNVVMAPDQPFGGAAAKRSLANLKRL